MTEKKQIPPEHMEFAMALTRMSVVDILRRIKNEELILRSQIFWLEKFRSFKADPNRLDQNIKSSEDEVRISKERIELMNAFK